MTRRSSHPSQAAENISKGFQAVGRELTKRAPTSAAIGLVPLALAAVSEGAELALTYAQNAPSPGTIATLIAAAGLGVKAGLGGASFVFIHMAKKLYDKYDQAANGNEADVREAKAGDQPKAIPETPRVQKHGTAAHCRRLGAPPPDRTVFQKEPGTPAHRAVHRVKKGPSL